MLLYKAILKFNPYGPPAKHRRRKWNRVADMVTSRNDVEVSLVKGGELETVHVDMSERAKVWQRIDQNFEHGSLMCCTRVLLMGQS